MSFLIFSTTITKDMSYYYNTFCVLVFVWGTAGSITGGSYFLDPLSEIKNPIEHPFNFN